MEHLNPIPNAVLLKNYIQDVCVQKVPPTLLVRYKGSEYSVPPKFIGKRIKIIPSENKLYLYFNTTLVCTHEISRNKFNYCTDHYVEGLSQSLACKFDDDEIERRAKENLAYFDQMGDM